MGVVDVFFFCLVLDCVNLLHTNRAEEGGGDAWIHLAFKKPALAASFLQQWRKRIFLKKEKETQSVFFIPSLMNLNVS